MHASVSRDGNGLWRWAFTGAGEQESGNWSMRMGASLVGFPTEQDAKRDLEETTRAKPVGKVLERPKSEIQWLLEHLAASCPACDGIDVGAVVPQAPDSRGVNWTISVDIHSSEPCFGRIWPTIDAMRQQFRIPDEG